MLKQMVNLLAVLSMLACTGTFAQTNEEAQIRKALGAKMPQLAIETITRMPVGGLYEVVLGGEVIYTDAKGEFLLGGTLYDLRGAAPRNVTQDTLKKIAARAVTSSPQDAIKTVRGNGKRVLYTFEDPNCGYCRQLYKELAKMTDITVYTYLLPVLSPDSAEKARAIWCAKDRAKAWDQMMTKGTVSEAVPKNCNAPLEKNSQVAQRLNVRGTPAVYLADGTQLGGYVPAQQLEQALARN
jgi:thiol:disulfide interchange protein DsbC